MLMQLPYSQKCGGNKIFSIKIIYLCSVFKELIFQNADRFNLG